MPESYNGGSDNGESEESGSARSVWSGTLAFGLVSLPVTMFTANRSRAVSLRLLSEDGTALQRRFFCSLDGKALERDDLVRGFEVDKTRYIEVSDDELEALAPKKSREIDLRRFVAADDIDPLHFKRAYFLLPEEGASKAYRLLAKSMEDSDRAGIATFVMRGKEYLLAIIARKGILRAETLRFHDEIRRPADLALPPLKASDKQLVDSMTKVINTLAAEELNREHLTDQWSRQLQDLVQKKLEADKDVLRAEELDFEEPEGEVIDLMAIIKQKLAASGESKKRTPPAKPQRASGKRKATRHVDMDGDVDGDVDAATKSKSELYALAKELNIHGRSQMSKQDLLQAIHQAR